MTARESHAPGSGAPAPSGARLGFVGCRYNTVECMEELLADGWTIHGLVTIGAATAAANGVTEYRDLRPFAAAHGIPLATARSYGLRDAADRQVVLALGLDAVLVIGWQRLIPAWWLRALRIGAFGMHGSPEPLPRGRGRSPLNWALILGCDRFLTNLFRYDAGIDSGAIVGTQEFEINPWDDILSLHLKNRMSMAALLRQHLPHLLDGTARLQPQPAGTATYYPKRTPADGVLDWRWPTRRLYDFCRGIARPYPGAFSFVQGECVRFWRVAPFDSQLPLAAYRPGQVVAVSALEGFVVRTCDGSLLVREYAGERGYRPQRGDQFTTPPEWAARLEFWAGRPVPGPEPA